VALQYVVITASWLEIIVGSIVLVFPNVPCVLLFGAEPQGIGVSVARFAGIALIGLGIACLPTRTASHRDSLPGLLAFNVGAAILFAWLAIATSQNGILTLPAAILHGGIAATLLLIRAKG